ncbi:MAG TPA: hypothetical protein VFZ66_29840 [Herpetosiphonaceae bacterium]
MDLDVVNWTNLFIALSVPLAALIGRCEWPDLVKFYLSFVLAAGAYFLGQWFDGQALLWPLPVETVGAILAAFGVQQGIFQHAKRSTWLITLAEFGSQQVRAAGLFDTDRRAR